PRGRMARGHDRRRDAQAQGWRELRSADRRVARRARRCAAQGGGRMNAPEDKQLRTSARTSAATVRLTMAQALIRALAAARNDEGAPLFAGVFAIFGHGNVAGVGEALYAHRAALPTYRAHNEQAMAHAAIAYAKAQMRRRMMACTTSIGPGATNLVTAAALAH